MYTEMPAILFSMMVIQVLLKIDNEFHVYLDSHWGEIIIF